MARNSKSTELMKWWMGEALIQLLMEKDYSKITIDDITEKAGVGRASWFRNFGSKNEAITYALSRRWKKYAAEKNIIPDDAHAAENSILYFEFIYSTRDSLTAIYQAGLESAFYDAYTSVMVPKESEDTAFVYHQKFFAFGLIGIVDEWIHRDFKESPEKMSKIFTDNILSIKSFAHP